MPLEWSRANLSHLSEIDRARIIGLKEAGVSFVEIANRMNRSRSTVTSCWRVCSDMALWMKWGRLQWWFCFRFCLTVTTPLRKTMVWGAITYGSLVFIRGNLTAQRYIRKIVEPHLQRWGPSEYNKTMSDFILWGLLWLWSIPMYIRCHGQQNLGTYHRLKMCRTS